jgi:hypothetical protein
MGRKMWFGFQRRTQDKKLQGEALHPPALWPSPYLEIFQYIGKAAAEARSCDTALAIRPGRIDPKGFKIYNVWRLLPLRGKTIEDISVCSLHLQYIFV